MSIIVTFLALGLSIFVHELGHFLAARRAGVHVEIFSIGLGPQIWNIYTDKKGTQWSLSIFPMGGYVKLLEEPTENKDQIPFPKASLLNRLMIISAGVISNILFAYFLICVALCIGIPMTSTTIGKVVPQSPADLAGIQVGEKIISFGGKSIRSWEDLSLNVALSQEDTPISVTTENEKGEKKEVFVSPTKTLYGSNYKTPFNEIGIFFSLNSEISDVHPEYKKIFPVGSQIQKLTITKPFKAEIFDPNLIQEILLSAPSDTRFVADLVLKDNSITTKEFGPLKKQGFVFPFDRLVAVSVIVKSLANNIGLQEGDFIDSIDGNKVESKIELTRFLKWGILKRDLQKKYKDIPVTIIRSNKKQNLVIPERLIQTELSFLQKKYRGTIGIVPYDDNNVSSVNSIKGVFSPILIGDTITSIQEKPDRFVINYKRKDIKQTTFVGKGVLPKKAFYTSPISLSIKTEVVQYPIHQAAVQGLYKSYSGLHQNATSFLKLAKGDIPLNQLGGPVRTFVIFKNAAAQRGICYFLLLVAQLGFSLALLNFLPIPALDGGHAALILLESLRGKPLSDTQMVIFNLMGLASILFLFFMAMYNDLSWLGIAFL